MTSWRKSALINLGLWGPPLVWATSLQFSQVLPYLDCMRGSHGLANIAFAALVLAVLSGGLVWHVAGRQRQRHKVPFLAAIATLSSAVFAYALALQAIATLVLTGCEK
jgi:hypothetical protein